MARKTLKQDWAVFTDGDFKVENNVWNKGDLVNGKDYTQSISLDTKHMTTELKFSWNWPQSDDIRAYPEIVAGYKPWSQSGTDNLTTRISDLDRMKVDIDYDITGDTDMFNAAFDIWLTKKPGASSDSITTEVMIWTHVGDIDPEGRKVGHYHNSDFDGEIWVANNFRHEGNTSSWKYITIVSDDEIRHDTIDIADILDNLVDRKLVKSSDFFNGYEFGAELTGGKGSMTIHDIDHTFATARGHGTEMQAQVSDAFLF
ncbi:MAG: hypothetical protein JWM58_1778 [Rhizobium sp.]|nr:hypothetical protein [Rhizobium sp.]